MSSSWADNPFLSSLIFRHLEAPESGNPVCFYINEARASEQGPVIFWLFRCYESHSHSASHRPPLPIFHLTEWIGEMFAGDVASGQKTGHGPNNG